MIFTYEQFDIRNYELNSFESAMLRGHKIEEIVAQFNDNDEINNWLSTHRFQNILIVSYIIGNKIDYKYVNTKYEKLYKCLCYLKTDGTGIKFRAPKGPYRTKLNESGITKSMFEVCKHWSHPKDFDHDLIARIIKVIVDVAQPQ